MADSSDSLCDALAFYDSGISDVSMDEDRQLLTLSEWGHDLSGTTNSPLHSDRSSLSCSPTSSLDCSLSLNSYPSHSPGSGCAYRTSSPDQDVVLPETLEMGSQCNSYPALCDAVSSAYADSEAHYDFAYPESEEGLEDPALAFQCGNEAWRDGRGNSTPHGSQKGVTKPRRKRVLNRVQRSAASVRERRRMVTFNSAFEDLKHRIPGFVLHNKKKKKKGLSRIDTLRCAIDYIAYLSATLEMTD